MAYEDKYQEFEQYLRSSEPDKVQRAKNWSIAIGMQQVDGLMPSDFLVSQAKENIEGRIRNQRCTGHVPTTPDFNY